MIRVLFDGRVIQDKYHGIGRVAFELLRGMQNIGGAEFIVMRGTERADRLDLDAIRVDGGLRFESFPVALTSLRAQLQWGKVVRDIRPDLVVAPYHLAAPFLLRVPVVSIIFDCIFEDHPGFAPNRLMLMPYRLLTAAATRRSYVVSPSETTASSIVRHYHLDRDRCAVVPLGVSEEFNASPCAADIDAMRRQLGLRGRVVVHVGVRRPHKNQAVLIRALCEIPVSRRPTIVFVGSRDARFNDPAPDLAVRYGLTPWVRFMHDVSERELRALYHASDLFAFPSFVEGFGLPLLEAMAAGIPVIASDIATVREVHGDAARLVPPSDSSAWAVAIDELLCDDVTRSQMSQRGRVVAARATWKASASRFLEVLNTAAEPHKAARAKCSSL